jgi:membrane-associated phospholipid phosphatase
MARLQSAGPEAATDADQGLIRDIGRALETYFSDFFHVVSAPARLNRRSALWVGGLAAATGLIYAYDQQLYDALHRNMDSDWYEPIRETGTSVEPFGFMGNTAKWMFTGLVVGYGFRLKPLETIMAQLLESHFISGGIRQIFVYAVGRRRPNRGLGPRSFEVGDGSSFFSGHSSNIVQIATVLSHHVDRVPFTIGAYGLAGTVLLQRISDDKHWPSDVFVGAVVGLVVSKTVLRLHDPEGAVGLRIIHRF